MTMQFQVGATYAQRFTSDWDSIASFTITARTAKTVTTTMHGKTATRRLSIYDGKEQFKPFGSYSMAMIVSADDVEIT